MANDNRDDDVTGAGIGQSAHGIGSYIQRVNKEFVTEYGHNLTSGGVVSDDALSLGIPLVIGDNPDIQGASGYILIGDGVATGDDDTVTIGNQSRTTGEGAVAIGLNSDALELGSVAIGRGSNAQFNPQTIAIGYNATSAGARDTSLGPDATAAGGGSVSVGTNSRGTGGLSVAVGDTAEALETKSVALGWEGRTDGNAFLATALGADSLAAATEALAVGFQAEASGSGSVSIGAGAVTSTPNVGRIGGSVNQLVFGGSMDTAPDSALGNGEMVVEMDESAGAFRLRGRDSTGTIREATVPW